MDGKDPICMRCIGNKDLRNQLRDSAVRKTCRFCESRRLAVSLRDVAERIDEVYREYYVPGQDFGFGQEGDFPVEIVEGLAEIEPQIAEAIVEILSAKEQRDVQDGADPLYDSGSHYVCIDFAPYEQRDIWREFCERIRHQRRYFDNQSRQLLAMLLGDLRNLQPSPTLTLHPGKPGGIIFRARKASSPKEARGFLDDPRKELGPPPPEKAMAGRMNAHGIPVFYGAFSEEVAVAEMRQSVGGLVVVGQFQLMRPLKLFELTRFTRSPNLASIFAPDFYERVTQVNFLHEFLTMVSRPIQPEEEALRYIATQAVAEYLSDEFGFDGLIYASAQLGGIKNDDDNDVFYAENNKIDKDNFSTKNVVLFNAIGLVANKAGTTKALTTNPPWTHPYTTLDLAQHPDTELQKYFETFLDQQKASRKPALRYIKNSAKVMRITRISVDYKWEHNLDQLPESLS